MIGVQKRKATCQQQPTNNNNEQTQQTANKRPRKRAKISSVNPSKTNNKQQNQRYQHQQATTCQFQQTFDSNTTSTIHSNHNNSNGSEESVWIFGLMNNIEQLLSTFSAINNNGSANSSHSLSSSSSSPSSSASISALSSPASTTSSTPSYSSTNTNNNTINSHSQSPSSSNFSTTNNVLSTSSSAISSMQQQQQAGTVCQATNQLPRSPISRQIKFHEYKGPPSSKRQQQQFATNSSNSKQQVKTIHSSNVSTAVNSNQTKLVGDIEREQQQLLLNRANMMMMTNKQQSKSSIVSDPSSVNFKAEANKSAPISTATATNTTTIINVASKPCNQQQALLVSNKQPCLLSFTPQKQQQQQQIQSQSLAMDHFQDLNQSFSIRTQTHTTQQLARQVNSSLASRVTSGPQFVQQQTNNNFYGGQVEHHGTNFKTPSDGPILLLAPPFIESKQELPIQPQLHYQQQQQQPQQQQQQPIFQQTRNQATPCSSHGASSVESPIFMRSLHNTSQQSICGLEFNLSVPARQQQQLAQPMMRQVNETDHQEEQVSFEPSFASSFEQKFDNHACLDSQLTTAFGSASEDGSEEQSTDEIEPSISFSQGVDELLFSEFIDLQDVPMNVDESDWLKKFLPPCSMG